MLTFEFYFVIQCSSNDMTVKCVLNSLTREIEVCTKQSGIFCFDSVF